MRIKVTVLFFLVFFSVHGYSQQSSDYFPSQTGYKWLYKQVPLDQNNNEIDSLTFFRADSFAVVSPYLGENADIVLSKYGSLNSLPSLPYIDSSFYNFHDTSTDVYFQLPQFDLISGLIDSLGLDTVSNIISVLNSLRDWYTVYKFGSPVNLDYTIFSKDTTVTINGVNFPLTFTYKGKRLSDETIQVGSQSYDCKKFLLKGTLQVLIFTVASIEDTVWISQGDWIVKDFIPTINIDLSGLGYGTFTIHGLKTEITQPITSVDNYTKTPRYYSLEQNYPNPFNPSTIINFSLHRDGFVQLKIFNLLGQELSTLVDQFEPAGLYHIKFNAGTLPSGIYFYRLIVKDKNTNSGNNFSAVKKMLLVK